MILAKGRIPSNFDASIARPFSRTKFWSKFGEILSDFRRWKCRTILKSWSKTPSQLDLPPLCSHSSLYWFLSLALISASWGFPCDSAGKESTCNVEDLGSIPGLGRSPREGKGYPLQYSGLENSILMYSPLGCKKSDTTEWLSLHCTTGFPGGSDSKESASSAGDPGSIPESGISPGGGNGYPLQ